MSDNISARLWHVDRALGRVADFIRGRTLDDYLGDPLLRSAVERQMQIVGEALGVIRKTRPDLTGRITDIRKVIGMRNILVHGYAEIVDTTVWDVVTIDAPILRIVIQKLLVEIDKAVP